MVDIQTSEVKVTLLFRFLTGCMILDVGKISSFFHVLFCRIAATKKCL